MLNQKNLCIGQKIYPYLASIKSYKFTNKFHNAVEVEIFINMFHKNGVKLKIGFILEHENCG